MSSDRGKGSRAGIPLLALALLFDGAAAVGLTVAGRGTLDLASGAVAGTGALVVVAVILGSDSRRLVLLGALIHVLLSVATLATVGLYLLPASACLLVAIARSKAAATTQF
jgi:hypothetical protein